MQGSLGAGVLTGLLREAYVGRRSGYLYFTRPGRTCSVLFHQGVIAQASSDDPDDWLGETLVRLGLISRERQQDAATIAERENTRLGRVLCELGLIDADALARAMGEQARSILRKVLTWPDGAYRFEAVADATPPEMPLPITTGDLILGTVRSMDDAGAVQQALGDVDRVLGLAADPRLRFQNITLTASDGFVLSGVDGASSAREVMQSIPLEPEETCRSLLGLLCTGVIEYLPLPPKTRPARVVRAPEPPAPAPPPAPPAPPSLPDPEIEARRRDVMLRFESLGSTSHYDLLGIARGANDDEVKQAYFRLARRFHPDASQDPALGDLRDKLEAVFIRLGVAYEALRTRHGRASYDATLPRQPVAAAAPPASEPADPALLQKQAAEDVRRAEKHLAESRFWDAIQLFESALPHLEGKLRQRALLGLARGLVRNPNWVKRAEETLQELLREQPQHVEALVELGLLYKGNGLRSRALNTFRRVLDLQPDHEQALLQAAELAPPPLEAESGLLKKLFGKPGPGGLRRD